MRHIKLFEGFNIDDDLKDICLELEDSGFKVTHTDHNNDYKYISISMDDSSSFRYDSVEEVVERIKDYMKGEVTISVIIETGRNSDTTFVIYDGGENWTNKSDVEFEDEYADDDFEEIDMNLHNYEFVNGIYIDYDRNITKQGYQFN